ncbi:VOC family protein [Methanomassiliicoccus luminyensis]|uniref:VOC family protein n=1 Tax=Methanomassiliicoccus luminyensis TaxID=1080712 RepID=UPI000361895F|nr:VOC family protein [Methanomassiliicoccus luminyensis]
MNHTIVHFDIPANDVEKVRKFYAGVFGWKTVDIPQMNYIMFQTVPTDEKGMILEPGLNGGLYKKDSENQKPVNYIQVESVDEYVNKAVKAGGRVVQPKEHIPAVGDVAIIADPEGNAVGLIRPDEM